MSFDINSPVKALSPNLKRGKKITKLTQTIPAKSRWAPLPPFNVGSICRLSSEFRQHWAGGGGGQMFLMWMWMGSAQGTVISGKGGPSILAGIVWVIFWIFFTCKERFGKIMNVQTKWISNFNSDYFMGVVVFCFFAGRGGGGQMSLMWMWMGSAQGIVVSGKGGNFITLSLALSKRFYDCFSHTAYSCSLKWTPWHDFALLALTNKT